MGQKIVLVTGASSGIGAAVSGLYAQQEASVVLVARDAARLQNVARSIQQSGGQAHAYAADLASPEEVGGIANRILTEVGVPDIIVNNAGAGRWASLVESSPEELRQMIDVPLMAALYVTRFFLPAMLERRGGSIVCVSSPASYLAWKDACGYISARRGLAGFCEALRLEVKSARVHVGLVILGAVDTPYWSNNPGSQISVPTSHSVLLPTMAADQAARAIEQTVTGRRRTLTRPIAFRLLIALYALAPRLAERAMRFIGKRLRRKNSQANKRAQR